MRQISVTLLCTGIVVGILLALGILSGDEQGRVNLLYVLLLFAFLPVVGLLLSAVFVVRKSGTGLVGLILQLPLWPARLQRQWSTFGSPRTRKLWLFYQTQFLSLGFSAGGILALVIVLLGSDVSFVWRSTLLNATDLFPVLHVLSLPWLFWSDAQPSMALLQQSQDFRLATPEFTSSMLGQWWKYVFAAQCVYNVLPRLLLLLIARVLLVRAIKLESHLTVSASEAKTVINPLPEQGELAPLETQMPDGLIAINWAQLPEKYFESLPLSRTALDSVLPAGPLSAMDKNHLIQVRNRACVILVRAWEPPMGELGDYLKAIHAEADIAALVLPVDWDENNLKLPEPAKITEWRRFCGALGNWSVLQLRIGESP